MRFLGLDRGDSTAGEMHMELRPAPERLHAGLTDCNGRVAVPGACAVDGSGLGRIHPPLQFDVVRLAKAFHEARCDLAAPTAVGGLDLQVLVQADEGAALSPTTSVRTSYATPVLTKISSVAITPDSVSKITSIGSWVPCGARLVAAPLITSMLVISSPSRKRTESTSCTTESLIMNSELK